MPPFTAMKEWIIEDYTRRWQLVIWDYGCHWIPFAFRGVYLPSYDYD
jgi:hypothetical protein